jgi:YycE-like protein
VVRFFLGGPRANPGRSVRPAQELFRRGGAWLDIAGDSGGTGRTTFTQPYPRTGRVPIRARTPRQRESVKHLPERLSRRNRNASGSCQAATRTQWSSMNLKCTVWNAGDCPALSVCIVAHVRHRAGWSAHSLAESEHLGALLMRLGVIVEGITWQAQSRTWCGRRQGRSASLRAPDVACLMETVAVGTAEPRRAHWPEHLRVGALRVVRWSGHYDQTVIFYRDIVGLRVLETFHDSYGLDGTILGLPGGPVHLEIVRLGEARYPAHGLDQLVFYLPDAAAQAGVVARLATAGVHPVAQIDYWEANGGVTYQDPDGREVVFASWIYEPPRS